MFLKSFSVPAVIAAVIISAVMVLALFSSGDASAFAQGNKTQANAPQNKNEKASASGDVAHGKYIVENVAMCGQCHTPTDSNGNSDRSRWLQGSSVPYMPARPTANWPISVPRIGGTPPANDADMVTLLTTGVWTDGNHLRLPMPQFRMDRSDAEAVVAYLKSLKPQP